jgi:6-carboxyhexanoate--CoA ligase
MWSIRMRASKQARAREGLLGKDMAISASPSKNPSVHISGAEGLCDKAEIAEIVREYAERAMAHPRGRPDSIIITMEKLRTKPRSITSLTVRTVHNRNPAKAREFVESILHGHGVSKIAMSAAFSVLARRIPLRGAALVRADSGKRAEPDKERGVRATQLGITKKAEELLSNRLARHGINTPTVREALILASKVASCTGVLAELCISDDPDYTTGYIASRQFGYIRVPHIKKKGDPRGGRVFFVHEKTAVSPIIAYLEKKPVLIRRISACAGARTRDEIIDRHHQ